MPKVYTRRGDEGLTDDFQGARLRKDTPRFVAIGDIDALNTTLGWTRAALDSSEVAQVIEAQLAALQDTLFAVGAVLAGADAASLPFDPAACVTEMECWIDGHERALPPLRNFILPAGPEPVCRLQLCRTAARQAERTLIGVDAAELSSLLPLLNRLSDFFFVASRRLCLALGATEKVWRARTG